MCGLRPHDLIATLPPRQGLAISGRDKTPTGVLSCIRFQKTRFAFLNNLNILTKENFG